MTGWKDHAQTAVFAGAFVLCIVAISGSNLGRSPGPQWDDVRTPALSLKVPAASAPDFDVYPSGGMTRTHCFPDGSDTELYGEIQLPHGYVEGTDIKLHYHWEGDTDPNATQSVRWVVDYAGPTGNAETRGVSTQVHIGATINDNEQNVQQIDTIVIISGTGVEISDTILLRIWRDGNGTLGTDDYVGSACLISVDMHYQTNSWGSNLEFSKS